MDYQFQWISSEGRTPHGCYSHRDWVDTAGRVDRIIRPEELLCVALHGDYRYDALKNTDDELQKQDEKLREKLIEDLVNTSVLIIGYSGRDQSIVDNLKEAYSKNGKGRLYWCGYNDSDPSNLVRELLVLANSHGRDAFYVPTFGFDDLIRRLSLHCLEDELTTKAQEVCSEFSKTSRGPLPPFSIESYSPIGLIKSNAFEMECPNEILEFDARGFDSQGAWGRLRQQIQGTDIVAGLFKGKVLAFGTVDKIKETFKDNIDGEIIRTPISEKELWYSDSVVVSLLTQALVRSIAGSLGEIETDNHDLVWLTKPSSNERVGSSTYQVYESAVFYLRRYRDKQYLIIMPTIKGSDLDGKVLSKEIEEELKRQVLSKQYNSKFNDAVNKWRERLFSESNTRFEFPTNCGSLFKFNVKAAPAFAKITKPEAKNPIIIPSNVQSHIVFSGMQFEEPYLLFSNKQGDGMVKDIHPIKGVVQNQPYDFSLTKKGLGEKISLGVICPLQDSKKVSDYLTALLRRSKPDSKKEYLLEYPGFGLAFGISLDIPEPHNNSWVDCPEPKQELDNKEGAIQLSHYITACIQSLKSSNSPNVILIFIPSRWKKWEGYNIPEEQFDLHDFIKAYCVQRGITTQFLKQDTLSKNYQCEVIWWLALSFYVKAMRTPWVLQSLDPDTAFMGIGYSLRQNSVNNDHVILGCSHIYNSEGLGLRYRLRQN